MNRTATIGEWRKQVRSNRLPGGAWIKIIDELADRTNAAEFNRSGQLIAWPSIPTLATATGLSRRMVHYAINALQRTGDLVIMRGGGRGCSNRYLLVTKTVQPIAPFDEAKPCNPLHRLDGETVQPIAQNGATHCAKTVQPIAPELLKNSEKTLAPVTATDPSGPRSRADRPLGPLDVEALRRCIGEDNVAGWFTGKVLHTTLTNDGVLTVVVTTRFVADKIRSWFEPEVLQCAPGALRLVVEVAAAEAGPPKARGRS
ncbi:hypothetical protein KIP88_18870 [Bradyrhizobium sp. SRL28]|uniref:hypothetical protein n=1 Tax=Bradyrhizobium sp. SRL28 TaxID=2836178 RepID=UPI001BDE9CBF|nr:hypothetical protein [Bradyrhizobium sp. SRL28]MBT1512570.1 hypothetical protein [Bradyrhizobium sp. SRL28]